MAVCEKRSLEETVHNAKNVLLDIEGTTTSISFVKDTLFPYVRKSVESYVTANWEKDEFKEVLTLLREQATTDVNSKVDGAVAIPSEGSVEEQQAAVVSNVLWQMDLDRKTTALKQLQGLVWRLGYKDGELKGHVYPDVAPALRRWAESGRKLYVYSSGSVEAQKLLFKYSQEGDLSELFSGHFDTTMGPKVEADSYKAIVNSLDCNPDNMIFLTDLPKEASAARKAGLPVVLVTREDAQELSADEKADFSSVNTLEDLVFEASAAKKQKVDETEASKNDVCAKAKDEKSAEDVAKMDVDEEKETPKTEVAEKEEPKTEVTEKGEKMEEEKVEEKVEDVKKTAETVAEEKMTETKEESEKKVEKMEDDSETKVEDTVAEEKPDEKITEKADKENTDGAKLAESAKPSDESTKTEKVEPKEVVEETKAPPVEEKKIEKSESDPSEDKAESEEKQAEKVSTTQKKEKVTPTETVEEKVEDDKTEKVKEEKQAGEVVEKGEEAKIEKKAEEKVEAVEDKAVENKQEEKEIEKGVEAKEETEETKKEESVSGASVESKVPKQNGLENGQSVYGVSNGKAEENGVKDTEEVVVKKAAVAAGADAEMATEA